jgi:DNA-directed RNA polymerase specialized sigma24 family protein
MIQSAVRYYPGIDFADIEEACSKLFVRSLSKFVPQNSEVEKGFKLWVLKTTRWITDFLPKTEKFNFVPYTDEIDAEFIAEEEEDSIKAIEHQAVREFVATLPDEKQQVLELRSTGHKWTEIADRLGQKVATIKNQVYRLRSLVQDYIRKAIVDEDCTQVEQPVILEEPMRQPLDLEILPPRPRRLSPFQKIIVRYFDSEYWGREVRKGDKRFRIAHRRGRLRLLASIAAGTAIALPFPSFAQTATGSGTSCLGWMCGHIQNIASSPLITGAGTGAADMIASPFWVFQLMALGILAVISLAGMLAGGQGREWIGAATGFVFALCMLLISNYLGGYVVGALGGATGGGGGTVAVPGSGIP